MKFPKEGVYVVLVFALKFFRVELCYCLREFDNEWPGSMLYSTLTLKLKPIIFMHGWSTSLIWLWIKINIINRCVWCNAIDEGKNKCGWWEVDSILHEIRIESKNWYHVMICNEMNVDCIHGNIWCTWFLHAYVGCDC